MHKTIWKKWMSCICAFATVMTGITPVQSVYAAENTVFINEADSDDENGGNDWVEIINTGDSAVDISGWYITDDKDSERYEEGKTWPLAEGTILEPGAVLVLEDAVNFDFGLGKNDTVNLYNADNQLMDTFTWTGHAVGSYSRVPDGTGEFVDQKATKGELNILEEDKEPLYGELVINEVNSASKDWVELINRGTGEIDISGYELRDNSDNHRWKFAEDTILAAGERILVQGDTAGFVYDDQSESYVEGIFQAAISLDGDDSIRLYDTDDNMIDICTWEVHASYEENPDVASLGRYPDGIGSDFVLMKETPNAENDWYKPLIVINEVESEDGDDADWVEVYNIGILPVDLSGWYMYDDDPVGHGPDIMPVEEGTVLNPGEFYVFDHMIHYTFYLGKADETNIYNRDGVLIDHFEWENHAEGVFARVPDGTGEFVDFPEATKGMPNIITNKVVLNEVQPNHGEGAWIELANPTSDVLDISGLVIKNADADNTYVIPENTTIKAYGFLVLSSEILGFELEENDSVSIFENDLMIEYVSWEEQMDSSLGLYPDMFGKEYKVTKNATPGVANEFDGIPNLILWPGDEEVEVYDQFSRFSGDASGLDFHDGKLYGVENGSGLMWILSITPDGLLTFEEGFETGKSIRFQKDADNSSAPGPDTEGITVTDEGAVYIASERDNYAKGANYNVILHVDPYVDGTELIALQEWDLTESLPKVTANSGIEAVEWVSFEETENILWDYNKNTMFDADNYQDSVSGGVFFVGLEENGHVYAYILNADGSVVQLADIDSKLGGVMALDYDVSEDVLWAVADNGYGNRTAMITLAGEEADIVHVAPPSGIDASGNHEGFAIADANHFINDQRIVYRFEDGVDIGALTIGSLSKDYKEIAANPNPFVDVIAGEYYYDPVLWAVHYEITNGLTETTFGTGNACTREQIVTFLWNYAKKPSALLLASSFKDVNPKHYYYNAMLWATEEGYVSGYNSEEFGVGDPCTREQIVTILWNYAGQPEAGVDTCTFLDADSEHYYYNAMLWAVENGIVYGYNDETFGVGDACTREQIVTFLYRYNNL